MDDKSPEALVTDRIPPVQFDANADSSHDLIGRDDEVAVVRRLVSQGRHSGGVMVVRGEPGIGKSALLAVAETEARAIGTRVLKVTGDADAVDARFGALCWLLRPLLTDLDRLAPSQRAALISTLDGDAGAVAMSYNVGLAALCLLSGAAASAPLLIVVEDGQWLDRPTREVLAFVARRLVSERIALLVAVQDGHEGSDVFGGHPQLRLAGLDEQSAESLVARCAPALSSALRSLVVAQAVGSPLALEELAAAAAAATVGDGPTPVALELPLGDRLARIFTAPVKDLPVATQRLLLLLACDDHATVADVVAAAELMGGQRAEIAKAIVPALDARIVVADGPSPRFAHPLLRSAAYQSASAVARRAAHAALSEIRQNDLVRRAWHEAASTAGPDAVVAAELHSAAVVAAAEGHMGDAFAAFERACWLSPDPGLRARSQLAAADAALELGWSDVGRRLVVAADRTGLDDVDRTLAVYSRRLLNDRHGESGEFGDLLICAQLVTGRVAARRLVLRAAVTSLWIQPSQHERESAIALADGLALDDNDPWRLAVMAGVGSAYQRGEAVARLTRIPADAIAGPDPGFALGFAASAAGQCRRAGGFLSHAVDGFRTQGRVVGLAQALTLRAWARIETCHWAGASSDAEDAAGLAASTGQVLWEARALAASGMLAAIRGDETAVEQLSDAADRIAVPRRATAAVADVLMARGHVALAHGRYSEAARTLAAIYHGPERVGMRFPRLAAIADFAEASVRSQNADASRAAREALVDLSRTLPAEILESRPAFAYAVALLADGSDADQRLREVLEITGDLSPFMKARICLTWGTLLRRARRVVDSREPLETAAADFEALGAVPWADRARQELRATGIQRRRGHAARVELTPQESTIAQLAATGLSNQQIGQRLSLSPRTVGTHLYRVFPKLGVASRGQLREALGSETEPIAV